MLSSVLPPGGLIPPPPPSSSSSSSLLSFSQPATFNLDRDYFSGGAYCVPAYTYNYTQHTHMPSCVYEEKGEGLVDQLIDQFNDRYARRNEYTTHGLYLLMEWMLMDAFEALGRECVDTCWLGQSLAVC